MNEWHTDLMATFEVARGWTFLPFPQVFAGLVKWVGIESDNTWREIKQGYHSHGADNKPERPHVEMDERNTRTGDRTPCTGEARKPGFPSKERFGSSRGFRGRDRLGGQYGERNQHRQSGIHVEKWKHDLFDEANWSPTPKNEEDQIEKVEALLAS